MVGRVGGHRRRRLHAVRFSGIGTCRLTVRFPGRLRGTAGRVGRHQRRQTRLDQRQRAVRHPAQVPGLHGYRHRVARNHLLAGKRCVERAGQRLDPPLDVLEQRRHIRIRDVIRQRRQHAGAARQQRPGWRFTRGLHDLGNRRLFIALISHHPPPVSSSRRCAGRARIVCVRSARRRQRTRRARRGGESVNDGGQPPGWHSAVTRVVGRPSRRAPARCCPTARGSACGRRILRLTTPLYPLRMTPDSGAQRCVVRNRLAREVEVFVGTGRIGCRGRAPNTGGAAGWG